MGSPKPSIFSQLPASPHQSPSLPACQLQLQLLLLLAQFLSQLRSVALPVAAPSMSPVAIAAPAHSTVTVAAPDLSPETITAPVYQLASNSWFPSSSQLPSCSLFFIRISLSRAHQHVWFSQFGPEVGFCFACSVMPLVGAAWSCHRQSCWICHCQNQILGQLQSQSLPSLLLQSLRLGQRQLFHLWQVTRVDHLHLIWTFGSQHQDSERSSRKICFCCWSSRRRQKTAFLCSQQQPSGELLHPPWVKKLGILFRSSGIRPGKRGVQALTDC